MIEELSYAGWNRCLQLKFSQMQMIVTLEVGPRIIDLRRQDSDSSNIFKQFSNSLGTIPGNSWEIFGGHRFWHSPEHRTRTYLPDNKPVNWEAIPRGVRLVQPLEEKTNLQKEIEIFQENDSSGAVIVNHRLSNQGLWPIECAAWALSVLKENALGFAALAPFGSHEQNLLPQNSLIIWPYTCLNDSRFEFAARLLKVRHNPSLNSAIKIGFSPPCSWTAGYVENTLFVKSIVPQPERHYPDLGSAIEIFANQNMLELETLSPLTLLEPGQTLHHAERWVLRACDELPNREDVLMAVVQEMLTKAQ